MLAARKSCSSRRSTSTRSTRSRSNAVDYLLKPVDPERLEQAVAAGQAAAGGTRSGAPRTSRRPSGRWRTPSSSGSSNGLPRSGRAGRERLAVKVGERFLLVDADDVIFASLADEVVTVAASGASPARPTTGRSTSSRRSWIPAMFWRVHRAYLVNINKIKEIVPWFSRNYILKMNDGKATEIPVSRSQTKRLREYLRL